MDAPGAAGGCDDIFPPRVPPPVFRSPNPVRRRHQLDAASEATSAAVAAAVAAAAASKRSVVADPLYFNPRPAAPGAADEDSTFVAGGGQKFDFQNPPATAASTGGQSQSMKTLDSS
ncbi:hypothetical protein BOX15_Mlig011467g1 [Macrostomum lignano]|uniref:Uncharacterized protein n=1 Tax=Macrostomum lignano TaxID=282301 RepID=A0A267GWY1_9PLAT|nr:hypothetical protein BOX15_Mlig011467g1 [Macrostomum lignano]